MFGLFYGPVVFPWLRIAANFGDKNVAALATRRSGHPGETDDHRAIEKSRETRFRVTRFQGPDPL
jgi:hypothetical protein